MKLLALMAAAFALGGCTTVLLPPNVTPVVAKTMSVPEAQRKLDRVKTERAAAEAGYAASEQLCYARFFVNNCLDAAKEKRRSTLAMLRAVEVEAELYERKAAVEQRDREVARAIREFEAEEARLAAMAPPPPREVAAPRRAVPKPALAGRNAKRAARQAEGAAEAPRDAAKRAANVVAFEQRKRESEERQKEVAAKKAEKAAKAAQPPAK
ncbi:MAG: hypothetical protein V4633_09665 [Pseudomonadota bacterium]